MYPKEQDGEHLRTGRGFGISLPPGLDEIVKPSSSGLSPAPPSLSSPRPPLAGTVDRTVGAAVELVTKMVVGGKVLEVVVASVDVVVG